MKGLWRTAVLTVVLAMLTVAVVYAKNNAVSISGWGQSFWQSPDDMSGLDATKTGIRITTNKDQVADGLASVEVFVEKNYDNLNAQAAQTVSALETGKTYRLTGKFKVQGAANSWRYRLMFGTVQLVQLSNIVPGIDVWTDAEYIFPYNFTSKEFRIQASGGGSIFADNLSLREVLYAEDGKTVTGYGSELLVNGNFESDLDLTPPGEVMNVQVANLDGQAKITWQNPYETDFKNAVIYNTTTGEKVLAGTSADGQILLSGLENGETYSFLIQTVDGWNNYSAGVTVTVQPVPSPLKNTEPVFYLNGTQTTHLSEGILKASVSFKNNSMPEDYSVELILVLLKDGALVDITSSYCLIPRTGLKEAYTEVSDELAVPAGEGYSAVLHIWDSITGMETLLDKVGIE